MISFRQLKDRSLFRNQNNRVLDPSSSVSSGGSKGEEAVGRSPNACGKRKKNGGYLGEGGFLFSGGGCMFVCIQRVLSVFATANTTASVTSPSPMWHLIIYNLFAARKSMSSYLFVGLGSVSPGLAFVRGPVRPPIRARRETWFSDRQLLRSRRDFTGREAHPCSA